MCPQLLTVAGRSERPVDSSLQHGLFYMELGLEYILYQHTHCHEGVLFYSKTWNVLTLLAVELGP